MNALKNVLAWLGGIVLIGGVIVLVYIGYGAIKASGAEEAKEEMRGELADARTTVRHADEKGEEANTAIREAKEAKDAANTAKTEAEDAKKAAEAEATLLMSQRRAFVQVIRAVQELEKEPGQYLSRSEYRDGYGYEECKLKKSWLTWAKLDFSKTGVKVGEQSFTFIRDAEGNVKDLELEKVVEPAEGTATKLNSKIAETHSNN